MREVPAPDQEVRQVIMYGRQTGLVLLTGRQRDTPFVKGTGAIQLAQSFIGQTQVACDVSHLAAIPR